MSELKTVLSLGAGVQSTTLLLMSLEGELPPIDYAVFADTGWEPRPVYEHLKWLQTKAEINVVQKGNIRADILAGQVNGNGRFASMPLHVLQPDGERGIVRRQCTREYKAEVVDRFIRRTILGLEPRQRAPNHCVVDHWFGISWDEQRRMRYCKDSWRKYTYPLIDRQIDREGCKRWLENHGYSAPRSACVGCPFHDNREWRWIRDNSPQDWQESIEFDKAIRNCKDMNGQAFLHRDCVPLDEVDLTTDVERGQLLLWDDECTGMCGV